MGSGEEEGGAGSSWAEMEKQACSPGAGGGKGGLGCFWEKPSRGLSELPCRFWPLSGWEKQKAA